MAVSYVLNLCGLVGGLSLIIVSALIAYISIDKLMRMSVETQTDSFAALFAKCAGPRAGPILDLLLFIYGNGASIGYLVFLADFLTQIFHFVAPSFFLTNRTYAIVASAVITFPLAMQRDTSVLRHIAPFSILALLYMVTVVTAQMPYLFSKHRGDEKYGGIQILTSDFIVNLPEAFSVCVFAFNCHMNVIPVAHTMVNPSHHRIKSISCKVNTLQGLFYSLVGLAGYLSWLHQTPGNLLTAYPANNPSIIVARIMLSITMMVAIPMNFVPTVRSGLQILDYFKDRKLDAETRPAFPRVVMTVICCACQVGLAIKVPGVADVLSLLGATVATAMIMGIPAYCMGKVLPKTAKNRVSIATLYVFALIAVSSVPIKILKSAKVMK